ncbi:enhancer of mRNA decapping 4 [Cichlidogyrus casuarinus]|uniref:Enhancer of mRNA decapping 4 n=1 Tax=Cichlidogyrus casuarinus TaxID=1844966 RepID=A0ABD2QJA7_9PLAT
MAHFLLRKSPQLGSFSQEKIVPNWLMAHFLLSHFLLSQNELKKAETLDITDLYVFFLVSQNIVSQLTPCIAKVSLEGANIPSKIGDIVNKAIRDKLVIDAKSLPMTLVPQLQTSLAHSHKDIVTKQLLPSLKEGLNKLFVDLNAVFATGTNQYLQNTDAKMKQMEDRLYSRLGDSQTSPSDPCIIAMSSGKTPGKPIVKPTHLIATQNNVKVNSFNPAPGAEKVEKAKAAQQTRAKSLMQPPAQQVSNNQPGQKSDIQISRLMAEAHEFIQRGMFSEAVSVALNAMDKPFLLDILNDIDKGQLFKRKVEQGIILSLINQLTINFEENLDQMDLKITYLQEAIMHMDTNNPTTSLYYGPLMKVLVESIAVVIQKNVTYPKTSPQRLSDSTLAKLSTLSRIAQSTSIK